MAIDKESTGLPEVDVHRRTTKVNLSMIMAVGLFFAIVFTVLFVFARRASDESVNRPSPSTENTSSDGSAPAQK
jgi:hypothetical protein